MTAPTPITPAEAVAGLNTALNLVQRIILAADDSETQSIPDDLYTEAYGWLEQHGAAPEYGLTELGRLHLEKAEIEQEMARLRGEA